jgi:hypothetical protein
MFGLTLLIPFILQLSGAWRPFFSLDMPLKATATTVYCVRSGREILIYLHYTKLEQAKGKVLFMSVK